MRAARLQDELLRRLRPLATLGLGHLDARPIDADAVAGRGAADAARRGARRPPRRPSARPRRADDRPAPQRPETAAGCHRIASRDRCSWSNTTAPRSRWPTTSSRSVPPEDATEASWSSRAHRRRCGAPTPPPGGASQRRPRTRALSGRSAMQRIRITGATMRNLRDVDCEIPSGALTVITGPSGAGKTTLARDVLLRVAPQERTPIGCATFDAPGNPRHRGRPEAAGQQPTVESGDLHEGVRSTSARCSRPRPGDPASEFTFNRTEGSVSGVRRDGRGRHHPQPSGADLGAVRGLRGPPLPAEVLEATWSGRSIADVLELSVDEASALFAEHPAVTRILETCRRSGSATSPSGNHRPACPVARRNECVSPARWPRPRPVTSCCSTSPRPACTRPTSTDSSHVLDKLTAQRMHRGRRRAPGRRDRRRRLAHRSRSGRWARWRTTCSTAALP